MPSQTMTATAAAPPPVARLTVHRPESFAGSWAEAHAAATAAGAPLFMPVRPYADDRGWSLMNLMAGVLGRDGQINFSWQHPGVVKAWHRHARQTDFWTCVGGHLKVGVFREEDQRAWCLVMGEQQPGVLIIPPGLWHGGAAVGAGPAGLLYYVTHLYDPAQPDEQRRAWDSVPGFPWATRHG